MTDALTPTEALKKAAYRFADAYQVLGDDASEARNELLRAALSYYEDQQLAPISRELTAKAVRLVVPDNPHLHGRVLHVEQTHYRGVIGTIPELYNHEGLQHYDASWDQIGEDVQT